MKIPEKSKEKKDKTKKKQKVKPKKEHVLIVAQEFKFARLLSGNEKKTRDRVLKTLKKWLLNCFEKGYEFKEDDFVRVWKGLFYAVWMSDKPLIQEELCENIAAVLDLFPAEHLRHALLMYQAGLRVLASEWYGLDQHRTDKFLMLVRRYLRASLRCLARCQWSLQSCQMYAKTLSDSNGIFALKTPHYARNALSMLLHVVDCYLEEIAKVSAGDIPGPSLVELLRPLLRYLCGGSAPALCAAARRLLTALLRQSEPGLRYAHATAAWQKMGCPQGGPEALELVSDDDDEEQNGDEVSDDEEDSGPRALDPRAGRVDVELPSLPVPAAELAAALRELLPTAASARHKRLRICMQRFEQLARDEYPLRVQTHEDDEEPSPPARVRRNRSAAALHALEKKLIANSDELALRGLGRKHRKRLLARSRAGASIVEETLSVRDKLSSRPDNGDWLVEPTEPEAKKQKKSPNKNENKRKNNATHAGDKKRRKSETNFKEAAAHERLKVADKSPVVPKLDNNNLKKVENGKLEKNSKDTNNLKNKQVATNTVKNVTEKQNNIVKKPLVPAKLATTNKNVKLDSEKSKIVKQPTVLVNKLKTFQKQTNKIENSDKNNHFDTPKKVKFALKKNCMQQPFDYYKSVRQSPNIPYDGSKQPNKTNLKPSTPSPINPFFKKKLKLRK